jgi:hypothetical protein
VEQLPAPGAATAPRAGLFGRFDQRRSCCCTPPANRLAQEKGQPSVITASKASLMTPLLFDPGDRWEYGSNIDWCGQVIEAIAGKRLGEVFKTRIFDPLDMHETTFELTGPLRQRVAGMHARNADGSLAPMDFELPSQPEVHMGGHGLYSSVGDYMRFIRMWLNDGNSEHGRVLKSDTVRMAEKNHLGGKKITMLPGVIASLSNDAEFFPGLSKSWALTFMVNDEEAPTGRSAGAHSAGRDWRTSSTGLIARTVSAASGPCRFYRSAIRRRSLATWISRPPSTKICAGSRPPDVREERAASPSGETTISFRSHRPLFAPPTIQRGQSQFGFAPPGQTPTCSAMARASSRPIGCSRSAMRRILRVLESIERGRQREGRIIDAGPDTINPATCEPCSH